MISYCYLIGSADLKFKVYGVFYSSPFTQYKMLIIPAHVLAHCRFLYSVFVRAVKAALFGRALRAITASFDGSAQCAATH